MACLTPTGLVKLKAASSVHVSSVRALTFDHVDHVDPATTDVRLEFCQRSRTRL